MPLTSKGKSILRNMQRQYGKEEGKRIFYSSARTGVITGVERKIRTKRYRHHRVRGKSSRGGYRRRL